MSATTMRPRRDRAALDASVRQRRAGWDVHRVVELAAGLADGLRLKVSSAPPDLGPERFLEELERIKRTR
jgi:hypothetical protein